MKIVKRVLPNGLTIILAPIEGSKTTYTVFYVGAGWKYEQPDNLGISHFVEHMMFKGTQKRPTFRDIVREIEKRGGTINAFTDIEFTCYEVELASRFADIAYEVLSDNILNSKFEPETMEAERGPVLEEVKIV